MAHHAIDKQVEVAQRVSPVEGSLKCQGFGLLAVGHSSSMRGQRPRKTRNKSSLAVCHIQQERNGKLIMTYSQTRSFR